MHPGKGVILYFIIIAVLLQSMSAPLVYLNFQLNREYIAANLCVNKNKPITLCGGKCYLARNLKEANNENKSGEKPSHKKPATETLYYSTLFAFTCQHIDLIEKSYFVYDDNVKSTFAHDIFHPPKA